MKIRSLLRIIGKVSFLLSIIIIIFFFANFRRVISSPFFLRLFVVAFILAGAGALAMRAVEGAT